MSRLIDADRLKEVVHRNTVGDLFDQFVDMQPTVKAISLDEVKKAREEIRKKTYEYSGSGDETIQAYCDGFKDSLKILDKLITESAEK
jgi:hypothetical protein